MLRIKCTSIYRTELLTRQRLTEELQLADSCRYRTDQVVRNRFIGSDGDWPLSGTLVFVGLFWVEVKVAGLISRQNPVQRKKNLPVPANSLHHVTQIRFTFNTADKFTSSSWTAQTIIPLTNATCPAQISRRRPRPRCTHNQPHIHQPRRFPNKSLSTHRRNPPPNSAPHRNRNRRRMRGRLRLFDMSRHPRAGGV
jgi:hypothetical protein